MANELQKKGRTFIDLLAEPQTIRTIQTSLPKSLNMDPARTLRLAQTMWRKNPKLMECDPISVLSAIVQAAQMGLDIDSMLGQAYLVPYGKICQLIPGYRGLIELARRTGQVSVIQAHMVYSKDQFEYEYGLQQKLVHVPILEEDRGERFAVYAYARFKDSDDTAMELMGIHQVDAIRKRSMAANNGPWVTDYDPMAKKTVIKQLLKYLPLKSEDLTKAIVMDDKAESGNIEYEPLIEIPGWEGETGTTVLEHKLEKAAGKSSNRKEPTKPTVPDVDELPDCFELPESARVYYQGKLMKPNKGRSGWDEISEEEKQSYKNTSEAAG